MKKIKQEGFTLIEVAIASFIISLLLISIIAFQKRHLNIVRKNYYLSIAYVQAYSLLDLLRTKLSSQAFLTWNQLNKHLLPQGQGNYECSYHHCRVEISWYFDSKQQISLNAVIL